MVRARPRFLLACLGAWLLVFTAPAKNLAAYRTGDVAEENISLPFTLDVIDVEATAARKAAEALKIPAIFRSYPFPTNAVTEDFAAAFETTRNRFGSALQNKFGDFTNATEIITAPEYRQFLAAFNRQDVPFPISAELAGVWTQGDDDTEIQTRLLDSLLKMSRRSVRSESVPAGFTLGDILRLAPAGNQRPPLTLAQAEQRGKLVPKENVITLTRLRVLFTRSFPPAEQEMALGLAKFLRINCEPDPHLTQQARDRDTHQLVVVDHYEAGQIIVRRGETIDTKTQAVLAQLGEKLLPGQLNSQLVAQREQLRSQLERTATSNERDKINNQTSAVRARDYWLIIGLAGGLITISGVWLWVRRRRPASPLLLMPAEKLVLQPPAFSQANLSPQITQILKDAVVQGLAAQRTELLQAQQAAASEINALVHRLDELKAPMQDRLRSYEERIDELEKDLAERNEENRELLKLKIEMTRRQLEAERVRTRVDFN